MIVSVSGFGYTGSGAVIDYLSEFGGIGFCKQEFNYLCGVDGLVDLARSIVNPVNRTGSSIYAIKRYCAFAKRIGHSFCRVYHVKKKEYDAAINRFVNDITLVSWKDFEIKGGVLNRLFVDELLAQRVTPHLERIAKKQLSFFPMKTVRLSGPACSFYDSAKAHIKQLLSFMGLSDKRIVVLDQAFSANNPQECFPFFESSKVIIVDKDPRDLYVFAREMLAGYGHFMPISNVQDFVVYYRVIRENQKYKGKDSRVLLLRFEDLIYKYGETTKKIRDFLDLPEKDNDCTIFNPKLSVGNTQLFKRFQQYGDDIKYIESQLSEYLYDFDSVGPKTADPKPFI